jgi:hypothetical protein
MMPEPLRQIEDGVVWYYEGETDGPETKHEGQIEVYPGWVRLGGVMISTWVPRERVQQVHES